MDITRGPAMASSPGESNTRSSDVAKPVFRNVELFDLGLAPAFIQDAIRPIVLAYLSKVDGWAIWKVTVGSYDWQDAAEEWALHRRLRESGAEGGQTALLLSDDLS